MDSSNNFLSTLQEKERELQRQLDALRVTISLFNKEELSNSIEVKSQDGNQNIKPVPASFDNAITWSDKILFALKNIESGFVLDIVNELRKYIDEDEKSLFKKVTGYASAMKNKKILGAKQVGMKYRYYIK